MFSKLIKQICLYVIPTKDDNRFYSLIKTYFKSPQVKDDRVVTLIDCSHLGFKRWNVQLLCTLLGIRSVNERKLIAFYPSYFLVWNTLNSKFLWLIKKLYNKDSKIFSLLFISKKITPRYSSYILSRYNCEQFQRKEDILKFEYKGIKVGDLLYDSYLKENKKATVDVRSKQILKLQKKACYLIDFYSEQYVKESIQEVYLTHSVYLCFGLAARVALKNNIKVFVTQNTRGKELQKLTLEHPLQTANFSTYKSDFKSLESPNDCLKEAESHLEERFKGVVNSSISYMRDSAYKDNGKSLSCISKESQNLLIMLHCFFDSPHIYKSMLYPDFYEWVTDTIKIALSAGKSVYIKEHPNGMAGNDKIVAQLKSMFPSVVFLDKSTSNITIMKCKIDAVATVYGTLGHEFPYKGIPVINAGDNPHSGFSFCYNPKSIQEYQSLIKQVGFLKKPTAEDKIEILQFYYIHNIFPGRGTNPLINKYLVSKFSPKDNYEEMIQTIKNVGIEKFAIASKNSYLALNK